jgi:hypothetical protein
VARSALEEHTGGKGFHTVLSDMCHDTMGADVADVTASLALCECAAKIALGSGFAGPLPDLPDLPVGFPSLCVESLSCCSLRPAVGVREHIEVYTGRHKACKSSLGRFESASRAFDCFDSHRLCDSRAGDGLVIPSGVYPSSSCMQSGQPRAHLFDLIRSKILVKVRMFCRRSCYSGRRVC